MSKEIKPHAEVKEDKLPIATVKDRLAQVSKELGLKAPNTADPKALRSMLDDRLTKLFDKHAPKLAEDDGECFGKPNMRDPKHPECKKCVHLVKCGEWVDKALAKLKDVAVNLDEESSAEEEAEEVTAKEMPKKKAVSGRVSTQEKLLSSKDLKKWPDYEVELVYLDTAPDYEAYDEDSANFLKLIYKKKPKTIDGFRKELMAAAGLKVSESKEMSAATLADYMENGHLRCKKV